MEKNISDALHVISLTHAGSLVEIKDKWWFALDCAPVVRFGLRGRLLVTVCLMLLFALVALSAVSERVLAADDNPFVVDGYVKDAGGIGIVGADVSIEMKHSGGGSTTHDVVTGDGGYYSDYFDGPEWEPGDTIVVTATYNSEQVVSPEEEATTDYYIQINLQFTAGIPELGSLLGFFVASGLVACVALVALGTGRKDQ